MIFNSIEFLAFGLFFFLLWPFFNKKNNLRWAFIVIASFFFYGWWDWRFLFLILFSGLLDFLAGLLMVKFPSHKKKFFAISLIGNIGSLAIFKYSIFAATIIEDLFNAVGSDINLIDTIPEFALILPVGISFYTFQSLSYTIDIYRGRLQPTKNILHFFSYLSMFPQLVAGPIVRASDFLKQLTRVRIVSSLEKWHAIKLIVFGFFQKVVIADNLSYFIDTAYQGKTPFDGTLYWWVVSIAFSFQIYCDFSGYSLIARGLAKMMGYHFKMNFNHPYHSKSFRQFWSRWHISLSTWFRDYVYIPLGGSKNGGKILFISLLTTMLLSGIWHGANYTFVIWALLHFVFLLSERILLRKLNLRKFRFLSIFVTFILVTMTWVYFRSDTVEQANGIVSKLTTYTYSDWTFLKTYFNSIVFLFLAILIEFLIYIKKHSIFYSSMYNRYNFDILVIPFCVLLILFFRGEGTQFIYFQF
ncbi:MAG: MBOAT family protein [Fluviicola sp.]|nr:MBOAT family protein [Fluviicola sp.]